MSLGRGGPELGSSGAAIARATTQKSERTNWKGPKGRDRVRPPGVLSTVGLPPAGGGAARLQPGCSLAGVVLASELLTDVPAVPWTHKRTTNTHCGYRGSAAPGVFCPGVFVDYGCHWHREFLGERGRSSRSLRLLQCDSSFPRKPVVPLFHLTEKYARVERNRVYQPREMTEQ